MNNEIEFKELSQQIAAWADGVREIEEVWIFGSRARGDHRSDSDIDVAVRLAEGIPGWNLQIWCSKSTNWKNEIERLLQKPVDLNYLGFDSIQSLVPEAVAREGVRIYNRSAE